MCIDKIKYINTLFIKNESDEHIRLGGIQQSLQFNRQNFATYFLRLKNLTTLTCIPKLH